MSKFVQEIKRTQHIIQNIPYGWIDAFRNYFYFKGRTNRLGFWSFAVLNSVILCILLMIDELFSLRYRYTVGNMYCDFHLFFTLYLLVTLIPSLALCVRRLHDLNLRGWWFLFAIIPTPYFYINFIIKAIFFVVFSYRSSSVKRFGDKPVKNFTV